jgi:plasmid stabilization system protein ParE
VTADPTGQELHIGERVDYTRAHLPATQRERYEQELREATERALDTGDYGPLGDRDIRPSPRARAIASVRVATPSLR